MTSAPITATAPRTFGCCAACLLDQAHTVHDTSLAVAQRASITAPAPHHPNPISEGGTMFGSKARQQERERRATALETKAAEWEDKAARYASDARKGRDRMHPNAANATVTRGCATDADEDRRACEQNAKDYRSMAANVRKGRLG